MTNVCRRCVVVVFFGLVVLGLVTGCTDDDSRLASRTVDGDGVTAGTAAPGSGQAAGSATSALVSATRLAGYRLSDDNFGTEVTVTVGQGLRIIESNALPNHETGSFPNPGNPNTISGQSLRYEFSTDPIHLGRATPARVPGVAINGVPFEPGTAETIRCSSGESYQIEALQSLYDLGLDGENAHVQPTGTYHYHGVSASLVESVADLGPDGDWAHVGFAADGFLILYSPTGSHQPGYRLASEPRTGTDCTYRGESIDLDGTTPDGTYVSDWTYDASVGQLDACNGITIDGEYSYVVTERYPFIPRCLMGDFTDPGPTGSRPDGSGAGAGAGGADADGG